MRISCVAFTALLAVGFSGTTYAQPPSNPSIVSAIKDLQTTINNLSIQVAALQDTVNTLSAPSQSAVRFTPVVTVVPRSGSSSAIAACKVVNVSGATIKVQLQLIGQDQSTGVLTVQADSHEVTLQPGHTGNAAAFIGTMEAYCRFAVIEGSRADIRGSMLSGLDTQFLVVEAE